MKIELFFFFCFSLMASMSNGTLANVNRAIKWIIMISNTKMKVRIESKQEIQRWMQLKMMVTIERLHFMPCTNRSLRKRDCSFANLIELLVVQIPSCNFSYKRQKLFFNNHIWCARISRKKMRFASKMISMLFGRNDIQYNRRLVFNITEDLLIYILPFTQTFPAFKTQK